MTSAQAERLFVPAPTRKLIVPATHVHHWGVDSSTLRVAIATIDAEGRRGSDIVSFPKLAATKRLPEIRRETYRLACSLAESLPPGVIVVEAPAGFGDRPNPELAYACGAIICALGEAAPAAVVELVASAKWKKDVLGYGAIRKPKPTDDTPYRVLVWAQEQGYRGTSWDEADAMAIAEYARRTYALDPR